MILSPAEPDKIIKTLRPSWIAVDCGHGSLPPWLAPLLKVAKSLEIPVIGWSGRLMSPVADLWRSLGGCVYRWPKDSNGPGRIFSLADINKKADQTELIPLVLEGGTTSKISEELSNCYIRLVRHAGSPDGQLGRDAFSIAWRYLRLLESIPVPLGLYDSECVNYWGMPSLSRLKSSFDRFLHALEGNLALRSDLSYTYERLVTAHHLLQDGGSPPLWLATANLVVEVGGPTQFVYQNRAQRDMFRFALLSIFNISESDLNDLGVTLLTYSELVSTNHLADSGRIILVGVPSRSSEWRIEPLLEAPSVQVVVWPHLEEALTRRASEWSTRLSGSCEGPSPIRMAVGVQESDSRRVRIAASQSLNVAEMKRGIASPNTGTESLLWKLPDAAAAIRAMFEIRDDAEDATDEANVTSPDREAFEEGQPPTDDDWVEEALRVVIEDGSQILLPLEDYVNVIARTSDGVNIVRRYSRSLRVGDEILLVNGEHRRSLYDLLVSRVHSHATISPWINLVDRWHQDLRRAFLSSKRRAGMTFESLLTDLQHQGSSITTPASVRGWIVGATLAPSDPQDIRRLGETLDIEIAKSYSREIGAAAGKLAGLHRSLSNRLNRWLASGDAGFAALSGEHTVVDAELGLTIEDFRHSLVRGRVMSVAQIRGPFLRSHIGYLRRTES
jgi:hypothetical protein